MSKLVIALVAGFSLWVILYAWSMSGSWKEPTE